MSGPICAVDVCAVVITARATAAVNQRAGVRTLQGHTCSPLCTRITVTLSTPATNRSHFATVSTQRTGLEPRTGASGDLERSWRRTRCNTADVT